MPLIAAKANENIEVINIPNNFLSLKRVSKDVYELEFQFFFNLQHIKRNNSFKVRVQSYQGRRDKLDQNTNTLIKNNSITDTRIAMERLSNNVGKISKLNFSTIVDLTSMINNSKVNSDGKNITTKIKSYNDSLVQESLRIEQEPISKDSYNYRPFISTLYSNYISTGIDPLEKISESFNKLALSNKLIGTKNEAKNDDPLTNIISSYFKRDNPEKKLSQVISLEKSDWYPASKKILVSRQDLNVNGWYFYFEVLNLKGIVIQLIEKSYNPSDLIHLADLPMNAPKIKGSLTNIRGTNYCSFTSHGSSDKLSDLNISLISSNNKTIARSSSDKLKNLSVSAPLIGSHVFGRSHYNSNDLLGNDFSSAVVIDKRHRSSNGCVIATQLNPGVFKILATGLHPRTISVIFYCKDLTNKTKSWIKITNQEKVNENNEAVAVFDKGIVNHIYEFYVETYLNDGTKLDSKSDIVESYSSSNVNLVMQVSDFLIDTLNKDVTFTLNFSIPDNSIDSIIKLLQEKGYQDYFVDNTQDQINQIKKFIGFIVFRFNITQGTREYLGSLLAGTFSDYTQSKMYGLEFYNDKSNYLYEIYPSIIDPSSMYDNQIQENYSPDLTKRYLSNNSKFKSLLTKKHSTIFSADGLKNKFSSTLLNNNVLAYPKIYTTNKQSVVVIENLVVNEIKMILDKYYNTLTWNCINNGSNPVDYFLINRCCNGRQLNNVGKVPFFEGNTIFKFLDIVDVYGNITYQVVPVYSNGIIGQVTTTSIFINGDL